MKVIFLDIETTGINTFLDSIIVIGIKELNKSIVQFFGSYERDFLKEFYEYLRNLDPEDNTLCGWKINRFDIPFIRARALVRELPDLVRTIDKFAVLDLAEIVEKEFTIDGQTAKSIEIIEALKINKNDKINGGDVPSLYKVGELKWILLHNNLDLQVTEELFLKLNKVREWIKLEG